MFDLVLNSSLLYCIIRREKCFYLVLVIFENTLQKQPVEVFCKNGVLKNFANFTEKHLCWNPFLIKSQAWGPTNSFKRASNTGVFLWNLWNFKEHLIWRTPANDCFLLIHSCHWIFFLLYAIFLIKTFLFYPKKFLLRLVCDLLLHKSSLAGGLDLDERVNLWS